MVYIDVDAQKAKLLELQSQSSVFDKELGERVLALESIKWKVESQLDMVDAFSDLLADGEKSYFSALASLSMAKVGWESVIQKLDTMWIHKIALSTQMEYMQASSWHPTFELPHVQLDWYDALETNCNQVSLFFLQ